MSKKNPTSKCSLIAGMAILPHLLLTACMDREPIHPVDTAPGGSTRRIATVPEFSVVKGERVLKDDETGQVYILNPNRTLLPQGENPQVSAASLRKSAVEPNYSAFDQSGLVEVKIWECKTTVRQEIQQGVACQVDPNYVVVGGGARTVYYGSGALLTEARPFDQGLYTYVASSKSHKSSDPHQLYVYVIGMRLVGVARNDLWLRTELQSRTSANPSESPIASVSTTSGYKLVGGGARVNWSHPGNMLTQTSPSTTSEEWIGAGKAHKSSSPATITVYAIGLNPSIPGFGNLIVNMPSRGYTSGSGGVQITSTAVTSGFVITCPGALSTFYSGSGRLLYGVYPEPNFHGGAWGASKDHLTGSAGNLDVWVKQIRKQ